MSSLRLREALCGILFTHQLGTITELQVPADGCQSPREQRKLSRAAGENYIQVRESSHMFFFSLPPLCQRNQAKGVCVSVCVFR